MWTQTSWSCSYYACTRSYALWIFCCNNAGREPSPLSLCLWDISMNYEYNFMCIFHASGFLFEREVWPTIQPTWREWINIRTARFSGFWNFTPPHSNFIQLQKLNFRIPCTHPSWVVYHHCYLLPPFCWQCRWVHGWVAVLDLYSIKFIPKINSGCIICITISPQIPVAKTREIWTWYTTQGVNRFLNNW